ncbi:MAG: enoyl-CoA hydratase/isomerase family protein [Chloroflexi bacterium]|nr:enoyl-CoA hydratase/isomerase family protein [Chloroflexota bacterium]
MSAEPRVLLSVANGIALATLNRPDVLNAFDDQMRTELSEVVERVGSDDSIRALILTGAGRGFSAGGDIRGMQARLEQPTGRVADLGWRRQRRIHHMVMQLHGLEKVTIAAVNGPAAGLGADLALCCDFIVAAPEASFVMSFILRGLIPDGGGMYFLPRRVGLSKAKELIFTGRKVSAEEAVSIGMADRLAAPDQLLDEATAWADELTLHSSTALALAKSILDQSFEHSLETVLSAGAQAQAIGYTTEFHRSSVEAFLLRSAERARSRPQE